MNKDLEKPFIEIPYKTEQLITVKSADINKFVKNTLKSLKPITILSGFDYRNEVGKIFYINIFFEDDKFKTIEEINEYESTIFIELSAALHSELNFVKSVKINKRFWDNFKKTEKVDKFTHFSLTVKTEILIKLI